MGVTSSGIVKRVENQGDRVLLYVSDRYHVIATVKDGKDIAVGAKITYEECGVNFGWLVAVEAPWFQGPPAVGKTEYYGEMRARSIGRASLDCDESLRRN